jgi:Arc/MetJ-type ribon-helix-helix transcriptional regulator
MPSAPWVTQNVALTPDIQDNLREYAGEKDLSCSQVVRKALTVLWRVEGWQSARNREQAAGSGQLAGEEAPIVAAGK